ncbi:hypothetical protein CC86DRAFT_414922 [Ophiobolus disseminans]|uniref:Uncharacterized protein n=1 Tax=Ophiobolus disseminans TaxID=1469910 RepID=A0A6A7AKH9_9PLEO|nr:hypothetical protein CC86DRAFT_414922 [Ophiobolus disseminans]
MWTSPLTLLSSLLLTPTLITAFPQATPSPTPNATLIPWSQKFSTFRTYLLSHPDVNGTHGWSNGPALQQTFADGTCFQLRIYNWNCVYDIPYKMRGIVHWLDGTRSSKFSDDTVVDAWRFYEDGYYTDPDSGWGFYSVAKLTFGACGNRGPQSACGMTYCVDREGRNAGTGAVPIPAGESPYMDPNNRDSLCPWLKGNGTAKTIV